MPTTGVTSSAAHTLDGLGKYYRLTIDESDAEPVDIVQALKDAKVDVLVSYLPVGSEEADKYYAQCAIDAGVAFVNALPVFIASDPEWAAKFEAAGVPIIGDDIKSQVGATITHRVMAKLFEDRGVTLDRTYQLNVGGNMDFKNMLERERLESKKVSKTQAVTSNLDRRPRGSADSRNVHIGPSDYVAWLDDRKWAYVRLEGRAFGDVPLNLEYKLEVWDSPNSAGIIIDAIRAAKIAKDRGIGGALLSASSYLMKSPPEQRDDTEGRAKLEAFIAGTESADAAGRQPASPHARRGTSRPREVPLSRAPSPSGGGRLGGAQAVCGAVALPRAGRAGPRVNNGRTSTSERSRRQKSALARRSAAGRVGRRASRPRRPRRRVARARRRGAFAWPASGSQVDRAVDGARPARAGWRGAAAGGRRTGRWP